MQKCLSHIVRALAVLSLTTALCGIAPAKEHRTTGTASVIPTYRVVPLGSHAFLNLPIPSPDVKARLTRLGVVGLRSGWFHRRYRFLNTPEDGDGLSYLVKHGKKYRLSLLPGMNQCDAMAVNDNGDVVGTSWSLDDDYTAVLWRHGRVYDLSAHCIGKGKWHDFWQHSFGRGVAINNRGQILTMSINNESSADFYLLEPVQTSARRQIGPTSRTPVKDGR